MTSSYDRGHQMVISVIFHLMHVKLVTAQTFCRGMLREQSFLSASSLCALICRRLLHVFHSVFPHLPFTSCPKVEAKCLSHNRLLYRFFSHCASHFLMWFADRPNPSGASVKWEVVFTTQHLHISVQMKPKEEMNAMLTSDSTPELDNSFAPIEASESMSKQRNDSTRALCVQFPRRLRSEPWLFEFHPVQQCVWITACLLVALPTVYCSSHCRENVRALLCSPNKNTNISYCRFIVHLHCMTSTLNVPYCAKV